MGGGAEEGGAGVGGEAQGDVAEEGAEAALGEERFEEEAGAEGWQDPRPDATADVFPDSSPTSTYCHSARAPDARKTRSLRSRSRTASRGTRSR